MQIGFRQRPDINVIGLQFLFGFPLEDFHSLYPLRGIDDGEDCSFERLTKRRPRCDYPRQIRPKLA